MAIRYILGRAGSGKSHQMLQEIHACLQQDSDEHLILLVPEQYTLQAERDLINKLNLPGIMRVEVLSFTRLAGRVLSEVGGLTRTMLNEQGKHMVLRKLVDSNRKDLTLYSKTASQDGFIAKLSQLIAELKSQDIAPQDLRTCRTGEREQLLGQKIDDIALLYEQFDRYLQGRYLDSEDYLRLLQERINDSSLVKNARIWLDSFTTFSPRSLKILDRLMPLVRGITVCLTLDPSSRPRDRELFTSSQRSLKKIRQMAVQHNLGEEFEVLAGTPNGRKRSPALEHLERELFVFPARPYPEATDSVEIFAAANLASEVEFAAGQIFLMAREKNWRWSDMAVVCNDMSHYGGLIKRIFNEYGIPVFMDRKRDIMNTPLIRFLLASGEVIRKGYRHNDMFTLLKSGLSGLDDDAIEQLENTALQFGISGPAWKQSFALPDDMPREELNQWRENLIKPLLELEQAWTDSTTVQDYCRSHFRFLQSVGLLSRLEAWMAVMDEAGRYDIVRENSQIWNIVLEIFDQMVEILGDQKVNLREYLSILESGCASLEVGIIPTTIDQVLVGSIQRTKSQDIQALLVLGANDGIIPSGGEEEGLLSETEKQKLQAMGLELDFEYRQQIAEENLLIYAAFSKPFQHLGISYALADGEGRSMRPSILIERLQKMLPGLTIKSDVVKHRDYELHQISTPASTFKYLVENMRQHQDGKPIQDFWADVYNWYEAQDEWGPKLELLRTGLTHRNQIDSIGADKARRLYNQPLSSSVSRIEQYVKCPFAHFVRYGLNPQERRIFEVTPPDIGELYHHSLLGFAQHLQRENRDWLCLQREEAERIMDTVMDELIPQQGHGIFTSTARYRQLVQRLKRIGRRTIWVLTEHLQRGEFRPLGYEVSFGPGGPLPAIEVELGSGDRLYLRGRIDRVDLFTADEASYVKIIDYKSGSQELRLSDIYYGLTLQLLIYLQAVLASSPGLGEKEFKPGGIFYFRIDDPMIESAERLREIIDQEIAKRFKMKGLVVRDLEIIRRMDDQLISTGSTDILPVALNGSGEFSKKSSALTEPEFSDLLRYVERLLGRIGSEIMSGRIRIEPVRNRRQPACSYCDFESICQFDRFLTENRYRTLRPLTDQEVVARIKEAVKDG